MTPCLLCKGTDWTTPRHPFRHAHQVTIYPQQPGGGYLVPLGPFHPDCADLWEMGRQRLMVRDKRKTKPVTSKPHRNNVKR